ncbi:MAG: hypothetical protein PHX21_02935 [bacterium]|nr:hypothetical protein [bacterium]
MEKQDLDNLQQTTKDYSMAATWLSSILLGTVFMISGFMTYFKIGNYGIISLLFSVAFFYLAFGSRKLTRSVMHTGLGYVRPKGDVGLWKGKRPRKIFLIGAFAGILIAILFLLVKPNNGTLYIGMLLVFGFVGIIMGLINWKKTSVFYNKKFDFYSGIYFIVCALLWMGPMKHIFRAHENAPQGITDICLGFWGIVFGIIRYFEYKNLVQKVKKTNE